MYNIDYTHEAINDLKTLQMNEPKVFEKARRFIAELAEHPKTGLGHPTGITTTSSRIALSQPCIRKDQAFLHKEKLSLPC